MALNLDWNHSGTKALVHLLKSGRDPAMVALTSLATSNNTYHGAFISCSGGKHFFDFLFKWVPQNN